MDLRHRVESKRAERERHEREAWDDDRSDTPPVKVSKLRDRVVLGLDPNFTHCGISTKIAEMRYNAEKQHFEQK